LFQRSEDSVQSDQLNHASKVSKQSKRQVCVFHICKVEAYYAKKSLQRQNPDILTGSKASRHYISSAASTLKTVSVASSTKKKAHKTSNAENTIHDDEECLPGDSEDDLDYFNTDYGGGDYNSDDDESGEAIISCDLIEESWIKVAENKLTGYTTQKFKLMSSDPMIMSFLPFAERIVDQESIRIHEPVSFELQLIT